MTIKPICIIPARGGSKRIKNKNIINFFGKPMIAHAIIAAKKSNLFSRIVVSTDSKKILKVAINYGAECPYLRNKKLSDDKTSTKDVLIDSIKKLQSNDIDYHFLIYPNAPLISSKDLIKAFNLIKKKKANAIYAVSKFPSHPLRAFFIKKNFLDYRWKYYQKFNSQNFLDYYFDTGSFYIFKTKTLLKSKNFLLKKTLPYFLPRHKSVDVNTYEDLNFLRILYGYFKK
jgi:pseudaminic acid cytidylyltransferase